MTTPGPSRALLGPPGARLLHALLVLGIIVAVGLRFYGLPRPLWLDEGASWWFAQLPWDALWGWLPRHENHSPLYYSLVKLVLSVGDSELLLRLPSLLCGVAAIAVTGLAARELGPSRHLGVLFAVAIAATAPLSVRHAYDARPYALELLGAALLTLGALRTLSLGSLGGERTLDGGSAACLIGGALLTAWSQYVGFLSVAAVFGALIVASLIAVPAHLRRRSLARVGVAGLLVLVGCLPILGAVMHRQNAIKSDFWTGKLTKDGVLSAADIIAGPAFLEWNDNLTHVVTVGLFGLAVAGVWFLWREGTRRPAALVLGASLVLPFVGLVLASPGPVSLLIPRSLIAIEVPLALLTAVTLTRLPVRAGSILCVLLSGLGIYGATLDATEELREDWPALLSALESRDDAGTIVIFESEDQLTTASYYHRTPLKAARVYRIHEGIVTPVPADFGITAKLVPFTGVEGKSDAQAALAEAGKVLWVTRGHAGKIVDAGLKAQLESTHRESETVRAGRILRIHVFDRLAESAPSPN